MILSPGMLATPAARSLRHAGIRALPVVGLLLVLLGSALTFDTFGVAPTQRNWVYAKLDHAHTVGQTFVIERDELAAVRVLLFANPTERDDPVTLRLRYADGQLPDLAEVTLPLRSLAHDDVTTFAFPPLTLRLPPDILTTTLRLDLSAPTLTDDWITVIAGPDSYQHGLLFVDERPRPHADLAFQPVYRRRWLDALLPISRMAAGKAGLLGWPPLYALLAYGYLVALTQVLIRLWRAIDAR